MRLKSLKLFVTLCALSVLGLLSITGLYLRPIQANSTEELAINLRIVSIEEQNSSESQNFTLAQSNETKMVEMTTKKTSTTTKKTTKATPAPVKDDPTDRLKRIMKKVNITSDDAKKYKGESHSQF